VILAHGAWRSRGLRVEGEDRPGVIAGIELLRRVAVGEAVELGRTVAVIGGGNTAIDSARTAVRLGAQEVNLFYRRSDVEMPASPHEVREAVEEGVQFFYLVAPMMVQEKGRGLKTLKLIKMELGEPDASGRRRPVPVEGSDYEVEVDTIVTAIGQYSDLGFVGGILGLVDERENLVCDPATGGTRVPGVFAAGDLVTGPDIVIRAIAGGKHAARAVAAYLQGGEYRRAREFLSKKEDFGALRPEDYRDEPRLPREAMPVLAPERRRRSFDPVELGFSEEQALREAARCLECGCQDVEECRLKQYAEDYGADPVRYAGEIQRHPIDESHPYITRDPAKCVLCGRCIRICLEVQGLGVLGYVNRGFRSVVVPTFAVPFGEDPLCISCGQCVSACPVGALTEKLPGGKTVPLPEVAEEGYCGLCSVACPVEYRSHGSLLARVRERVVLGEGCEDGGTAAVVQPDGAFGGRLCVKGRFQHFLLGAAPPPGPLDRGRSLEWGGARERLDALLRRAQRPSLRLSPVLSGEALERFLDFARRRSLAVTAFGLESLGKEWAQLIPPADAAAPGGVPVRAPDRRGRGEAGWANGRERKRAGDRDPRQPGPVEQRRVHRVPGPGPQGDGQTVAPGLRGGQSSPHLPALLRARR
jgi:formate dehydrogenase major subunit